MEYTFQTQNSHQQLLSSPLKSPLPIRNTWEKSCQTIRKIGSGGYATVYFVKMEDESESAIKKTRSMNTQKLKPFLDEVNCLLKCQHPNIIRFKNAWLQPKEDKMRKLSDNQSSCLSSSAVISQRPSLMKKRKLSDSFTDHKVNNTALSSTEELEQECKCQKDSMLISSTYCMQQCEGQEDTKAKREEVCDSSPCFERTYDAIRCSSYSSPSIQRRYYGFLETEVCEETLHDYLQKRNAKYFEGKNPNSYNEIDDKPGQDDFLSEALEIAQQLLCGIQYLHQQIGIGHLDIKPQNIFLNTINNKKQVKIGDFGNAKTNEDFVKLLRLKQQNKKSNLSYTQMYAPPEFLNSISKKQQNELLALTVEEYDLYSLGVVFLQLFAPMQTSMEMIQLLKHFQSASSLNGEQQKAYTFKPELDTIISQLLQQIGQNRPSLSQLQNQITQLNSEYFPQSEENESNKITSQQQQNSNDIEYLKLTNSIIFVEDCSQSQIKQGQLQLSKQYFNKNDFEYILNLQRTNSDSTTCSSSHIQEIFNLNSNFSNQIQKEPTSQLVERDKHQ